MPIKVQTSMAWKEIPVSLFATVLLLFLLNDFAFTGTTYASRLEVLIILVLFCLLMYYVFNQMKNAS